MQHKNKSLARSVEYRRSTLSEKRPSFVEEADTHTSCGGETTSTEEGWGSAGRTSSPLARAGLSLSLVGGGMGWSLLQVETDEQ